MYEKVLGMKETEREVACVIRDSKHAQSHLGF